ncbi:hypothetical protein BaRGS_00012907 [Batillaria attramentaria]|uniref:PDZ domain-containing protein n=1 Tax=Batillaria attramentaria TaxID=370345 RepID=A0ABD0L8X2_9CAEN
MEKSHANRVKPQVAGKLTFSLNEKSVRLSSVVVAAGLLSIQYSAHPAGGGGPCPSRRVVGVVSCCYNNSETAAEYLERLQAQLWDTGDHSRDDDIASIICMLDSPLFKQLLTLQESLQDLQQVSATQPLTEDSFDISPTGELLLASPVAEAHAANDVSAASTLSLRPSYIGPGSAISTHSYNIEFQRALERVARGRQTETICLYKPENTSLGFSVVGLKAEDEGELGIYVQDIQPAGLAAQ